MTTTRSTRRLARAVMLASAPLVTVGLGLVPTGTAGAATTAHLKTPITYRAIGGAARLPAGDRIIGRVPPSRVIRADVVLQPRSAEQLTRYATAVSSPHSGLYRQYLSPAAFRQAFAPPATTRASVEAQLRAAGLTVLPVAADGLVIPVEATATRMGSAFRTTLDSVRLPDGRAGQWAVTAPELPASVASSVLTVVGLDELVTPAPLHTPPSGALIPVRATTAGAQRPSATRPSSTGGPAACAAASVDAKEGNAFTDDQVAHAYGFDGLYSKGILGAGQTVGLFEEDVYATSDLRAFDECYLGADHTSQVKLVNIDGGEPPGVGGGEATLDVEDVSAYAPGADIDVYDAPGTFIGWIDEMAAIVNQDKASVVNVSYGLCETQMAEAAPGLIQTENILFEEAALQGQTFVAASGDAGSETCFRNDTSNTSLSVSDPASQPFATSVGGTSLKAATFPPVETVWNDGGSGAIGSFGENGAGGGGISQVWTMPAWQAAATTPGIHNKYSTGSLCGAPAGTACREVPDVTASADELHGDTVVYGGGWTTIGGTSAAAPKWVALLALTNNYCATLHDGSVGFVSPALYQIASDPVTYAEAFNDITEGNNDVLGSHDNAYPATVGYDLASGLGSPRATGPGGSPGLGSLLCSDGTSNASHPVVTSVTPNHGSYAGGTAVTITGTKLAGVTKVQFGPASVTVTPSDITGGGTEITVDTPPSPTEPFDGHAPVGGVLVAVSGSNGTSAPSVTTEFHYLAGSDSNPVPSVYYVAPSSAAAGATITIYGSGYLEGGTPSVKFGGVAGTGVSVVSDIELKVKVPAQTGSTNCATVDDGVPLSSLCQVEVTVTNSFGTSATQPILPPPTGLVFNLFIPAAGTENVPAVTEFDYAPAPVISSVSPNVVGLNPFGSDPFTPDILTVTGTGFNYFSLQRVEATVPGHPSLNQSLFVGIITPTTVEFDVPVYGQGGLVTPPAGRHTSSRPRDFVPASFQLNVVSAGQTSNTVVVDVATSNITVTSMSRHAGSTSGGKTVTLTGTNLTAVTGILYSGGPPLGGVGTTTDLSIKSSTELTFVTPAMVVGTGSFSACDASVCVGSAPVTEFDYYDPVQPVVTSISPSSGSAGGGERVTIEGTGLGSVTGVKFGSRLTKLVSNPALQLGDSTTSVVAEVPAGVVGSKVPITVITLAGTSKPAAVFFTYEKGAPGPPVIVSVSPGAGEGVITWMPPANDGGSPILGYSVSAHAVANPFSPIPPSAYSPSVNLPASARSAVLPVTPYMLWSFEVKAHSALGVGSAHSNVVLLVTLGDDGYAIGAADGTFIGYGDLGGLPSGSGGTHPKSPVVGLAVAPSATGYWTVTADGVVHGFGSTRSYGSLAPKRHSTPVVALVADASGGGYWIVTSGGGVFAFGNAKAHGLVSGKPGSPIVGAAETNGGGGYWLVSRAGKVFPFGDAKNKGSLVGSHVTGTVVAIMADPIGNGYWLVTSTGGVYAFGGAAKLAGLATSPAAAVVGATPAPSGKGCWLVESDGTVVAVGRAQFEGDPAGTLESTAVAIGA